MSLKLAAEHLKTHGRGEDTELVHMTKGELKGLQDLAQAHGGSLTVNPNTGLPEAGFLSNLLPTILGVGAGILTGDPLIGAAIGGIGGYATSGTLMGGIMAGMGAWGGTNFLNDLAAAAPQSVATLNQTANVVGQGVQLPGSALTVPGIDTTVAGAGEGIQLGANAIPTAGLDSSLASLSPQATTAAETAAANSGTLANATSMGVQLTPNATATIPGVDTPTTAGYTGTPYKGAEYAKYMDSLNLSPMDRLSQTLSAAGSGAQNLLANPSTAGLAFLKENPWTTLGVASTVLGAAPKPTIPSSSLGANAMSPYEQQLLKYKLSPDFKGYVPPQPSPAYQAQYPNYAVTPYNPYAAQGGVVALKEGGQADSKEQDQKSVMDKVVDYAKATGQSVEKGISDYVNAVRQQLNNSDTSNFPSMAPDSSFWKNQNFAEGGIAALANGGQMMNQPSDLNFMDGGMYPQSQQQRSFYATPSQMPMSAQQVAASYAPKTNPLTGEPTANMAVGGIANAGNRGTNSGGSSSYNLPGLLGQTTMHRAKQAQATPTTTSGPIAPPVAAQVYTPTYTNTYVPSSNPNMTPMAQPNYSLADSAGLLGAYAPYIAGMAKGGSTSTQANPDTLTPAQAEALAGIYTDSDPNTRNLDPWSATAYKLNALQKRFGVQPAAQPQLAVKGLGDVAPADFASGGDVQYNLGGYSDGGRLLKGPGDGMSDNIPATIGQRQPARLADGEFVVPADVVSHLGNGSTDAGAKQLYNMMDKVRKARTGNPKQGKQINPAKYLPK